MHRNDHWVFFRTMKSENSSSSHFPKIQNENFSHSHTLTRNVAYILKSVRFVFFFIDSYIEVLTKSFNHSPVAAAAAAATAYQQVKQDDQNVRRKKKWIFLFYEWLLWPISCMSLSFVCIPIRMTSFSIARFHFAFHSDCDCYCDCCGVRCSASIRFESRPSHEYAWHSCDVNLRFHSDKNDVASKTDEDESFGFVHSKWVYSTNERSTGWPAGQWTVNRGQQMHREKHRVDENVISQKKKKEISCAIWCV